MIARVASTEGRNAHVGRALKALNMGYAVTLEKVA